jgi:CheY-like chemotaxis protein
LREAIVLKYFLYSIDFIVGFPFTMDISEWTKLYSVDIRDPNDGFELHRQLKKIDNTVKICFLTASEMYYEEFRKDEFCGLDKDLFLRKPIKNKDLIIEIHRIHSK